MIGKLHKAGSILFRCTKKQKNSRQTDTNESFSKYIKQYAFQYGANTSGWKKYLEYS